MNPINTEVLVVGAGPGGYAAAFYAADLGKKVVLVWDMILVSVAAEIGRQGWIFRILTNLPL